MAVLNEVYLCLLCCVLVSIPDGFLCFNIIPRIRPSGLNLVPYGINLTLYCDSDVTHADNLHFYYGGAIQPSEKINGTTIKLELSPLKGVYTFYCMDELIRKTIPVRVLVDEPPRQVTDFQCRSYNLDKLECIWTAPQSYSITNYTLSTIINEHVLGSSCTPSKKDKILRCSWTAVDIPRYRQQEETFNFMLQINNAFGVNEQNFTIDHFSIMRPAPVYHLKVIDTGAYNAVLEWTLPRNMVDLLPGGVNYKIEYQIDRIDNRSYYRSVDTASLPPRNLKQRLSLALPYAGRRYQVRVSIRPVQATAEEFWSSPTWVTFVTLGKPTSEINKMLFRRWRQSASKFGAPVQDRMWRMRGQGALRAALRPGEPAAMTLLHRIYRV